MKTTLNILIVILFHFSQYNSFGQNQELVFSHEHGFYSEPFNLIIASSIDNSDIYYTLDGSNPLTSGNRLIGDKTIILNINPSNTSNRDVSPAVVVRACIVHSDTLVGRVHTQTYLFSEEIINYSVDNLVPGPGWLDLNTGIEISYGLDPEIYNSPQYKDIILDAFLDIPTISIVTDPGSLFNPDTGIYVNSLNHGKEWERAASIELLNPDGSEGFQENCGIRIRGGWSRHNDNPKHAFRVIFRKEYGVGKLHYPLFGNEGSDEFENIDLRTSQNYSWSYYGDKKNTFLREVFSRDTQRDMGQPYTRSRYYHLFLNGTYWGLYQTQERSESYYAESYFGGDKDDYDVIKVEISDDFTVRQIEATDGTLDKWRELWNMANAGFNDFNYFKAQGLNIDGTRNLNFDKLLDIDNLIDYMIITFFVGDFDGPVSAFINNEKPNNFYAIINRVNPDGFKFFRHDAEHSLLDHDWGTDRTGPFPAGNNFLDSNPQWIHQKLMENEYYRRRFADRVYQHFFNDGALTYQKNRDRIEQRKEQIELAIIAESARWGDSKSETPRTKVDWENEVNYLLNSYLPARNNVVLNQLINKNLFWNTNVPIFNLHGGIVKKGFEVTLSSTGGEIYYTTDGSDPIASDNNNSFMKEVITTSTPKRVIVPTEVIQDSWRSNVNFNDENWAIVNSIPGGIGYDTKGIYNSFISYNTSQAMHESGSSPNTSCYIRIKFNVDQKDIDNSNNLKLHIRYDDGFVAYLNGTKVLQVNSPDNPNWNSNAMNYLDSQNYVSFDLSDFLTFLTSGENLLAIHGLNYSIQSSDFLILPTLELGNINNSTTVSAVVQKYSQPIVIDETRKIKARSLNYGEWSVLTEAEFLVDEDLSTLKITEIHYHPLDEIVGTDTISGKKYEFVELKNIGKDDINLTGSKFVKGISFEFPTNSILKVGEFFVLASDSIYFKQRYGYSPDFQFSGNLDNSGERLVFTNPVNDTVFTVRFNDKLPWPVEADGEGYSLVSKFTNPLGNPDAPDYWVKSANIHGSPFQNDIVSDVENLEATTLSKFYLYDNYPNPFNPSTTISYNLPDLGGNYTVNLTIYDTLGKIVKRVLRKKQSAGHYKVEVNLKNISSGVYIYQLTYGKYISTNKMLLLK